MFKDLDFTHELLGTADPCTYLSLFTKDLICTFQTSQQTPFERKRFKGATEIISPKIISS